MLPLLLVSFWSRSPLIGNSSPIQFHFLFAPFPNRLFILSPLIFLSAFYPSPLPSIQVALILPRIDDYFRRVSGLRRTWHACLAGTIAMRGLLIPRSAANLSPQRDHDELWPGVLTWELAVRPEPLHAMEKTALHHEAKVDNSNDKLLPFSLVLHVDELQGSCWGTGGMRMFSPVPFRSRC